MIIQGPRDLDKDLINLVMRIWYQARTQPKMTLATRFLGQWRCFSCHLLFPWQKKKNIIEERKPGANFNIYEGFEEMFIKIHQCGHLGVPNASLLVFKIFCIVKLSGKNCVEMFESSKHMLVKLLHLLTTGLIKCNSLQFSTAKQWLRCHWDIYCCLSSWGVPNRKPKDSGYPAAMAIVAYNFRR